MNEYMDCEHLHLLKDEKNEVSVNKIHNLKQHQIDGLRFLFKQFKKKKSGVIINFPPACGKSVTVVLFLNAVRSLLKLPILILSKDENEIKDWKENFANWTEFREDEIAIESRNPLIKKKIFIKKSPVKLSSYLSRSWSIVIVKEDTINKEFNKLIFLTDFKIWITSTDIKEHLPFLSFVYTWLNPKTKMNLNDFVAKDNRPTEKYEKSVLLETFLEEVLIQKNVNIQPFHTKEKTEPEIVVSNESKPPKRSLKNKDATGTKIKRSKKRIEDTDIVDASNQLLINNETINVSQNYDRESDNDFTIRNHERKENEKNRIKLSENDTNGYDSPKLDVESFIRDQQPLQATSLHHRDLDLLFSLNKKDESNAESEFTDTLHFTMTANKSLRDENLASQDNLTESLNFDADDKIEIAEMNIVLGNDEQSLDNQNVVKLVNVKNTSIDVESAQPNEIISIAKEKSIESLNFHDHFEVKINETVFNINQNYMNADGTNILNDKANTSTFSTVKKYNEAGEELGTNTSSTATKVDDDIDRKKTGESDKSRKDIDCKISELEEKTLKKFKGSILDSIF